MRILFVGFPDSIHTARWINQLVDQNWDIHLFPVHDGPIHADLCGITVHSFFDTWPLFNNHRVVRKGMHWPVLKGRGKIKKLLGKTAPRRVNDSVRLAQTIQKLKPDVLHVLEMQHAGYLALESFSFLSSAVPPCVYSSWGSDLYRYGSDAKHSLRIRAFLKRCDFYIADCWRDVALVRNFGFKGETLAVLPVAGGFNLPEIRKCNEPISTRRVIALKGYQGDRLLGRALVALEALRHVDDMLERYEVVVHSADRIVSEEVQRVAQTTGIRIAELPSSPHVEVMRLMGRSRIAIAVGLTDGTPLSMLEAMSMGALPIQSDTGSTREWIENGQNGLLVPPEDVEAIVSALKRALTDDQLVSKAAEINFRVIAERADAAVIGPQVVELYQQVSEGSLKRHGVCSVAAGI